MIAIIMIGPLVSKETGEFIFCLRGRRKCAGAARRPEGAGLPVCRAGKRIAAEGALCGDGVCGAPPLNTLYLKTGMDCFAALAMTGGGTMMMEKMRNDGRERRAR